MAGSRSFEARLDGGADAAARARALLAEQLDGALDPARLHEVLLATTELVTNAVRHGGDAADELSLRCVVSDRLRVEVRDTGASGGSPHVRRLDHETPGGLGLLIVEQLSDAWGVERASRGLTVWFEMNAVPAADGLIATRSAAARAGSR